MKSNHNQMNKDIKQSNTFIINNFEWIVASKLIASSPKCRDIQLSLMGCDISFKLYDTIKNIHLESIRSRIWFRVYMNKLNERS